jgi:hypothetical protein
MTDPEQDEAFEAYLKRRSVLPDALAADDRLEPPAALDALVLRKAREAIRAQPAPDQGRAPRWAVPVALAATIMLCLSVVMNISLNTNRPAANLQRATAARADGSNTAGDRRESAPGAGPGDIPSHEVILPGAKVAGSPAPHPPMVAEQAAASASAPPAPAPPAPAPAAPAAGRTQKPPSVYADSQLSQATTDERRVASRSAADKAATFAKRADVPLAGAASESASASAGNRVAAEPGASTAGAPRDDAARTSQPTTAGAPQSNAVVGRHPTDPTDWLQQIAALRAAGKITLADAEMRRFRAAFPGYASKPTPPASSEPPK